MSEQPRKWFRFYSEWLDDPKIKMLSDGARLFHVEMLCLKAKGCLPAPNEYLLRVLSYRSPRLIRLQSELTAAGLLSQSNDIPTWNNRQPNTDTSGPERSRRWRDKKKEEKKPEKRDVTRDVLEIEKRREDKNPPYSPPLEGGTPAAIIEVWNPIAKKRGWRKCTGCEADLKKIRAALNRREFREHWRADLAILDERGLPFVGQPGEHEHWKPQLGRWFCRPETHRKIAEGEYWDGDDAEPNPPQAPPIPKNAISEARRDEAYCCGRIAVEFGDKCPCCHKEMIPIYD